MALSILNEQMLHGGDYNPDQWLDRPDILEKDIAYMKETHVNAVSVAIFAWAALEPEEGHYTFDWLEQLMDKLYENGIYTVLATPSAARPVWMVKSHPEVMRMTADQVRLPMMGRANSCYASPYFRQKVHDIDKKLSERFARHPGVILWHLSNEYSGACFCPTCVGQFRKWLEKKYGTIEKLNKAWWTPFWSHTYFSFDQVDPPYTRGEHSVHALALDWKRFVTDQTVDFMKMEAQAVREGGSQAPITTNLMGFYEGLNYFKFADVMDIASWDNYPQWQTPEGKEPVAIRTGMAHDLMRSIKQKPFLMMESSPGPTNWEPVCRLKRPGVHEMSSLQAVAHGSNSVQYFQWRQGLGGQEKFHGAVVRHDGTNDTRMFREVAHLGRRLTGLSALCRTNVEPETAIMYDWENRWILEEIAGNLNKRPGDNDARHYLGQIEDHYAGLWHLGIPVDLVDMSFDFSRYKLVIAPMLYLQREGIVDKLRRFVENGGTLVGTYLSGYTDENDHCFECFAPNGLQDVFGVESEELDGLYPEQHNRMLLNGRHYVLSDMCDVLRVSTAKVLGTYEEDFYRGGAVLTRNSFGKGRAYYLASRMERGFYRDFYEELTAALGIERALGPVRLPDGVTANLRKGAEGTYVLVQNYQDYLVDIPLAQPLIDAETGEESSVISMAPLSVRIFRRP